LYVANSGGLSSPNYDKTVSVINLTTLTEIKKIEVILNPGTIAADNYGNVYVLSTGNYKDVAPGMTVINNVTDVVKSQSTLAGAYGSSMIVNGDLAYLISAANNILVYNVKKQAVEKQSFITDGTKITSPFNIALDPTTGEVFVTDARDYTNNGKLFAFDKNGKKEYDITTGITPGAIAILK
jgi:DNA-binding beta-propeller fold protein YncE